MCLHARKVMLISILKGSLLGIAAFFNAVVTQQHSLASYFPTFSLHILI